MIIILILTCGLFPLSFPNDPGFRVPQTSLISSLPATTPASPVLLLPACGLETWVRNPLGTCSGLSLPAVPWGPPTCCHCSNLICLWDLQTPLLQGSSSPALILETSHDTEKPLLCSTKPMLLSSFRTHEETLSLPEVLLIPLPGWQRGQWCLRASLVSLCRLPGHSPPHPTLRLGSQQSALLFPLDSPWCSVLCAERPYGEALWVLAHFTHQNRRGRELGRPPAAGLFGSTAPERHSLCSLSPIELARACFPMGLVPWPLQPLAGASGRSHTGGLHRCGPPDPGSCRGPRN